MSDICTVKKSTLDGIAEAIQSKTGESGRMLPSEMKGKIEDLPSQPAKGLVFSEYDSDGYPHKAEFVGSWTEIPNYYFERITYTGTRNIFGKITEITIPDGVTSIGVVAFEYNVAFTTVNFPDNDITINSAAFNACTKLTALHFYGNVVLNGANCFDSCVSILSIIFEKNVNAIPNNAFKNSTKCTLYDFSNATAIPSLYSVASLGHASGCVIRIPLALSDQTLGTGNGWESATNWSALTNIVWEAV